VTAFPDLSAARLTREIRELGYAGAYTAVKRYLAAIRPENGPKPYEMRFETPPGVQAQVDFARFVVDFADDPGTSRIIWLFSLVLGHSRFIFARYVRWCTTIAAGLSDCEKVADPDERKSGLRRPAHLAVQHVIEGQATL
jgi:hypothetical protein